MMWSTIVALGAFGLGCVAGMFLTSLYLKDRIRAAESSQRMADAAYNGLQAETKRFHDDAQLAKYSIDGAQRRKSSGIITLG